MVKRKKSSRKKEVVKERKESVSMKNKPSESLAIVGLILNILVLPGLGSLVGGKVKQGVWQLVLVVGGVFIGLILTITIIGAIIGIPMMIFAPLAAWIWGIVTGVEMIKEAQ